MVEEDVCIVLCGGGGACLCYVVVVVVVIYYFIVLKVKIDSLLQYVAKMDKVTFGGSKLLKI